MRNPWTKKNPFMSMWLSAANTAMGSARGHASAAAKRQATTMMSEGTRQVMDFWSSALTPAAPKKKSTTRIAKKKRKTR